MFIPDGSVANSNGYDWPITARYRCVHGGVSSLAACNFMQLRFFVTLEQSGAQLRWIGTRDTTMFEASDIEGHLRHVRDTLRQLRREIAAAAPNDDLQAIDALVGVAEDEAQRALQKTKAQMT